MAIDDVSDRRRAETADGSWQLWTALGIGGIWVAVVLISVFSPDMVSGSEHEHLPVAAFFTWFWGAIATAAFLWGMGKLRGDVVWRSTWIGLSVVTLVLWGVATVLSIILPVVVTGSDPTELPVATFFGPVGATVLTGLAGVVTGVFSRGPGA